MERRLLSLIIILVSILIGCSDSTSFLQESANSGAQAQRFYPKASFLFPEYTKLRNSLSKPFDDFKTNQNDATTIAIQMDRGINQNGNVTVISELNETLPYAPLISNNQWNSTEQNNSNEYNNFTEQRNSTEDNNSPEDNNPTEQNNSIEQWNSTKQINSTQELNETLIVGTYPNETVGPSFEPPVEGQPIATIQEPSGPTVTTEPATSCIDGSTVNEQPLVTTQGISAPADASGEISQNSANLSVSNLGSATSVTNSESAVEMSDTLTSFEEMPAESQEAAGATQQEFSEWVYEIECEESVEGKTSWITEIVSPSLFAEDTEEGKPLNTASIEEVIQNLYSNDTLTILPIIQTQEASNYEPEQHEEAETTESIHEKRLVRQYKEEEEHVEELETETTETLHQKRPVRKVKKEVEKHVEEVETETTEATTHQEERQVKKQAEKEVEKHAQGGTLINEESSEIAPNEQPIATIVAEEEEESTEVLRSCGANGGSIEEIILNMYSNDGLNLVANEEDQGTIINDHSTSPKHILEEDTETTKVLESETGAKSISTENVILNMYSNDSMTVINIVIPKKEEQQVCINDNQLPNERKEESSETTKSNNNHHHENHPDRKPKKKEAEKKHDEEEGSETSEIIHHEERHVKKQSRKEEEKEKHVEEEGSEISENIHHEERHVRKPKKGEEEKKYDKEEESETTKTHHHKEKHPERKHKKQEKYKQEGTLVNEESSEIVPYKSPTAPIIQGEEEELTEASETCSKNGESIEDIILNMYADDGLTLVTNEEGEEVCINDQSVPSKHHEEGETETTEISESKTCTKGTSIEGIIQNMYTDGDLTLIPNGQDQQKCINDQPLSPEQQEGESSETSETHHQEKHPARKYKKREEEKKHTKEEESETTETYHHKEKHPERNHKKQEKHKQGGTPVNEESSEVVPYESPTAPIIQGEEEEEELTEASETCSKNGESIEDIILNMYADDGLTLVTNEEGEEVCINDQSVASKHHEEGETETTEVSESKTCTKGTSIEGIIQNMYTDGDLTLIPNGQDQQKCINDQPLSPEQQEGEASEVKPSEHEEEKNNEESCFTKDILITPYDEDYVPSRDINNYTNKTLFLRERIIFANSLRSNNSETTELFEHPEASALNFNPEDLTSYGLVIVDDSTYAYSLELPWNGTFSLTYFVSIEKISTNEQAIFSTSKFVVTATYDQPYIIYTVKTTTGVVSTFKIKNECPSTDWWSWLDSDEKEGLFDEYIGQKVDLLFSGLDCWLVVAGVNDQIVISETWSCLQPTDLSNDEIFVQDAKVRDHFGRFRLGYDSIANTIGDLLVSNVYLIGTPHFSGVFRPNITIGKASHSSQSGNVSEACEVAWDWGKLSALPNMFEKVTCHERYYRTCQYVSLSSYGSIGVIDLSHAFKNIPEYVECGSVGDSSDSQSIRTHICINYQENQGVVHQAVTARSSLNIFDLIALSSDFDKSNLAVDLSGNPDDGKLYLVAEKFSRVHSVIPANFHINTVTEVDFKFTLDVLSYSNEVFNAEGSTILIKFGLQLRFFTSKTIDIAFVISRDSEKGQGYRVSKSLNGAVESGTSVLSITDSFTYEGSVLLHWSEGAVNAEVEDGISTSEESLIQSQSATFSDRPSSEMEVALEATVCYGPDSRCFKPEYIVDSH